MKLIRCDLFVHSFRGIYDMGMRLARLSSLFHPWWLSFLVSTVVHVLNQPAKTVPTRRPQQRRPRHGLQDNLPERPPGRSRRPTRLPPGALLLPCMDGRFSRPQRPDAYCTPFATASDRFSDSRGPNTNQDLDRAITKSDTVALRAPRKHAGHQGEL